METQFFDVFVTEGENPTFAYRTGLTTYTEGLRDGIFTALGWNGAGYMALAQDGYDPTILNPADYIAPQAFELELDGQSLMSHWAYEGLERLEGKDNLTVKITLRHTVRPVTVRVCTLLDGSCVFSRWLEIENRSQSPAALGRLAVLSGGLETTLRWQNHIKDQNAAVPIGSAILSTRAICTRHVPLARSAQRHIQLWRPVFPPALPASLLRAGEPGQGHLLYRTAGIFGRLQVYV